MIAFMDLPDTERFRLINAIDEHGGSVETYSGECVLVALPSEWRAFVDEMSRHGLEMVPGSRNYWPLGTDHYPEYQRHDGSYPGSRGFSCLARFNVPAFCLV